MNKRLLIQIFFIFQFFLSLCTFHHITSLHLSTHSFPVKEDIFNISLWWSPFFTLNTFSQSKARQSLKAPSWQEYAYHLLSDHNLVSSELLYLSTVSTRELMSLLLVKNSWCTSALGTWGLCMSHWWECDWASVNWRGHLQKENCTTAHIKDKDWHIVTGLGSLKLPELLWPFHLLWVVWKSLSKLWLGNETKCVRVTSYCRNCSCSLRESNDLS